MLGDLAFHAFMLVGIPAFTVYALLVWEGRLWRDRLARRSRRADFWGAYSPGGFTVGSLWCALSLDGLLLAWYIAQTDFLPPSLRSAIVDGAAWTAISTFLLWFVVHLTGWPRWALPPWFHRSAARTAKRPKHIVTVYYAADAAAGTAPYFVAMCTCTWFGDTFHVSGELAAARAESFADAKKHSSNVRKRVKSPLDPLPRR